MAKAGLKPGQRHSGQFKKGHDPRRQTPVTFRNGQAFREVCREKSPEAVEFLYSVMRDEEETTKNRVSVARYIIEQGYGKPTTPIAVASEGSDVAKLTSSQIDAKLSLLLEGMGKEVDGIVIDQETATDSRSETIDDNQYLPQGSD